MNDCGIVKILVVDDEMAALNTFAFNLVDRTDVQYQMFRDDPQAAIDYAKNNECEAAFLDISMPKMNGIDLAKALIKETPAIQIFFITSYTFDEEGTAEDLGENFGGFCYKPYDKAVILKQIERLKRAHLANAAREVKIRTFDGFDIFVDGAPVDFRSKKSKELLAFAVNKDGAYATMEEAVEALWPNKDSETGKISYRDSVWKLKRTLNENGLDSLVEFQRGRFRVNKNTASCDAWDVIHGNSSVTSIVSYLPTYEWAMNNEAEIMDILEEHQKTTLKKI
jgi:two-component system LytT family response regulator